MAIAYVSKSEAFSWGTSVNPTWPSTSDGDIAIATLVSMFRGSGGDNTLATGSITKPSGWTMEQDDHVFSGTSFRPRMTIFSYPCDGTETGNIGIFDADNSSISGMSIVVTIWSGTDGNGPDVIGTTNTGYSASPSGTAITTSANNDMVIAVQGTTSGWSTSTVPSGMTNRSNTYIASNRGQHVASVVQATAGSTGAKTFTCTIGGDGSDHWRAVLFSLTATTGQTLSPSGIASTVTFGTASLALDVVVAESIASTLAFGTPSLYSTYFDLETGDSILQEDGTSRIILEGDPDLPFLQTAGIASTLNIGTVTLGAGNVNVVPTGLASTATFGAAPTFSVGNVNLATTGIGSTVTFGDPNAFLGNVNLVPTGLASTVTFGDTSFQFGNVNLVPTGLASTVDYGSPVLLAGGLLLGPAGALASTLAFGTGLTLDPGNVNVVPTGIASTLAIGSSYAAPAGDYAINDITGIASTVAYGTPSLALGNTNLNVPAWSITTAIGSPSVLLSGEQVIQADSIGKSTKIGSLVPVIYVPTRTATGKNWADSSFGYNYSTFGNTDLTDYVRVNLNDMGWKDATDINYILGSNSTHHQLYVNTDGKVKYRHLTAVGTHLELTSGSGLDTYNFGDQLVWLRCQATPDGTTTVDISYSTDQVDHWSDVTTWNDTFATSTGTTGQTGWYNVASNRTGIFAANRMATISGDGEGRVAFVEKFSDGTTTRLHRFNAADITGSLFVYATDLKGNSGDYIRTPQPSTAPAAEYSARSRWLASDWLNGGNTGIMHGQHGGSGNYGWRVGVHSTGKPFVSASSTGSDQPINAVIGATITDTVDDPSIPWWVRVDFDSDGGASNFAKMTVYFSSDDVEDSRLVTNWIEHGSQTAASSFTTHDAAYNVNLGSHSNGTLQQFAGRPLNAQFFNDLTETSLIYDFNMRRDYEDDGTSTGSATTGEVWTFAGSALNVAKNPIAPQDWMTEGVPHIDPVTGEEWLIYVNGLDSGITDDGLLLTGLDGYHASAPDSSKFTPSGELTFQWFGVLESFSQNSALGGQYTATTGNRSWFIYVGSDGQLSTVFSSDGTATDADSAGATLASWGFSPGDLFGLQVTHNPTTGDINYYSSTDGENWTYRAQDLAAAQYTLNDPNSPLYVGTMGNSTLYDCSGITKWIRVYDGSTLVASPNFAAQEKGTPSFTDDQHNVWTMYPEKISYNHAGVRTENSIAPTGIRPTFRFG